MRRVIDLNFMEIDHTRNLESSVPAQKLGQVSRMYIDNEMKQNKRQYMIQKMKFFYTTNIQKIMYKVIYRK